MDSNVLRECAQRLVETADFIRNFGNHSAITTVTTATSTTPTSTAAMPQPQPNNAPTDGRVHDTNRNEHNRLFSYRPPAPTRVLQLRGSRTSRSWRHLYTNSAAGRANATWSRSFVCLAVAGQQTPPSTSERDKKKLTGLHDSRARVLAILIVWISRVYPWGPTPFVWYSRGYCPKTWVGVCGALFKTLTLFQTWPKIQYPISDLTQNSIPYFRPDPKFNTLFQTCPGTASVYVDVWEGLQIFDITQN